MRQRDFQQRGLHLRDAVVRAQPEDLFGGVFGATAVDDAVAGFGIRRITGGDQAAFAAGQSLGELHAERAEMPPASRAFAAPLTGVSVRRILDHDQVMFGGNRHDRVHIGHRAAEVHRDNRAGAFGDRGLNRRRADAEGLRVDVAYHRDRAQAQGCPGGRREGDCRN